MSRPTLFLNNYRGFVNVYLRSDSGIIAGCMADLSGNAHSLVLEFSVHSTDPTRLPGGLQSEWHSWLREFSCWILSNRGSAFHISIIYDILEEVLIKFQFCLKPKDPTKCISQGIYISVEQTNPKEGWAQLSLQHLRLSASFVHPV